MKRGQTSVEFIIIFVFLILILLGIIVIADRRENIVIAKEKELFAKEVATQLAAEINAIYLAGPGIRKEVTLPTTLRDGTAYNVTIYPTQHLVVVQWYLNENLETYSLPIAPGTINGSITELASPFNISNRDGIIQLQ